MAVAYCVQKYVVIAARPKPSASRLQRICWLRELTRFCRCCTQRNKVAVTSVKCKVRCKKGRARDERTDTVRRHSIADQTCGAVSTAGLCIAEHRRQCVGVASDRNRGSHRAGVL